MKLYNIIKMKKQVNLIKNVFLFTIKIVCFIPLSIVKFDFQYNDLLSSTKK